MQQERRPLKLEGGMIQRKQKLIILFLIPLLGILCFFWFWSADERAAKNAQKEELRRCLLYTSPSPRDRTRYRMPSSA